MEIGPLCDPIVKNRGMPYTSSEQCQGICVGNEEASNDVGVGLLRIF